MDQPQDGRFYPQPYKGGRGYVLVAVHPRKGGSPYRETVMAGVGLQRVWRTQAAAQAACDERNAPNA